MTSQDAVHEAVEGSLTKAQQGPREGGGVRFLAPGGTFPYGAVLIGFGSTARRSDSYVGFACLLRIVDEDRDPSGRCGTSE